MQAVQHHLRNTIAQVLTFVVFSMALVGCVSLNYYASSNQPVIAELQPNRPGTIGGLTIDDLARGGDGKPVFVGITMSGGGSRAANFSAAVLIELEKLGFLRHVSAISSVSGSSLTAAYYGLFRDDKQRWNPDNLRELLGTNFEAKWLVRWFWPHNIIRYWFSHFDRSDIMKDVFDDVLFQNKTFGDMPPGSPKVLINATSFTTGKRFVFNDETFRRLQSRLDIYPISHAVMASGAFPAAFHNVTLQNYRISASHHYEHLYDGGPSDNLGIQTLLEAARKLYKTTNPQEEPKGCFLFVVDAYPFQELPGHVVEADTRKAVDFIIDTNAVAATDSLLTARREDVLENIGIDVTRGDIEDPFAKEFSIFPRNSEDADKKCSAWHISFQRLLSHNFIAAGDFAGDLDRYRHARQVGLVVNSTPTRYQLTGVEPFTTKELQDYIYEAGRLLVREDRDPRKEVSGPLQKTCRWFTEEMKLPGVACNVSR